MIDTLKPLLRAFKYSWLHYSSEFKTRHYQDNNSTPDSRQLVFLIGCGRSGTTILGSILSHHDNIYYLFEPYHLWAAIEPKTDALNLYSQIEPNLLMNANCWNGSAQVRFNHLIRGYKSNKNKGVILEKTPLNAMRIGYLNAFAPQAKFIHLVRDGVDVSLSIERIASINNYKIFGKPQLNQWWGVKNSKWNALLRDGIVAGYFPDEVHHLQNHRSKAAYEWLVSLGEVDKWREYLGSRVYEITYNQLTLQPETTLQTICKFLELDSPKIWLSQAIQMIKPPNRSQSKRISLPSAMCKAFNSYQEQFAFPNRAIPLKLI
jgi:hypothetical protein